MNPENPFEKEQTLYLLKESDVHEIDHLIGMLSVAVETLLEKRRCRFPAAHQQNEASEQLQSESHQILEESSDEIF